MPYTTIGQLPRAVREDLPKHARNIWMSAYNSAYQQGLDEESCARIAWSAVEKSYKKDETSGKWVHVHHVKAMEIFSAECAVQATDNPKLFWKEVIYTQDFVHPQRSGEPFVVTSERMRGWVENFKRGVPQLVPVPIQGPDDESAHNTNPMSNTGFVKDMEIRPRPEGGESLWALMEIVDPEVADKVGKTICGCSLRLVESYTDAETGEDHGETIEHICLTNTPYIEKTGNFVEAEREPADIQVFVTCRHKKKFEKGGHEKVEIIEKLKALMAQMEAEGAEPEALFERFIGELGFSKEQPMQKAETEKQNADAIDFERLPEAVRNRITELERWKTEKEVAENERLISEFVKAGKLTPAVKPYATAILNAGMKHQVDFEKKSVSIASLFEKLVSELPASVDFSEHGEAKSEKPPVDAALTPEKVEAEAERRVAMLLK